MGVQFLPRSSGTPRAVFGCIAVLFLLGRRHTLHKKPEEFFFHDEQGVRKSSTSPGKSEA